MLDKDEKLDPRIWKILAVVLLGPFMTVLDSTVVNVSLSSLAKDLHTSIGSIQWIVSGYLLSLALMLPLSGWLVDRLGAKRIYLISFAAFTAASVLCGAAHTSGQLVAFRVFQGRSGRPVGTLVTDDAGALRRTAPSARDGLCRDADPDCARFLAGDCREHSAACILAMALLP